MTKKDSSNTENTELQLFQGSTSTDLATRNERVGQGSENVQMKDRAIPRLKLAQAISKEAQIGTPEHIEGLAPGMYFDTVNRAPIQALYVINVAFTSSVVVWKKRKAGGGMFGSYDTIEQAEQALVDDGKSKDDYDIRETPSHVLLVIDPATAQPTGELLFDMPGAKAAVSRNWNTLIDQQERAGNPRFGVIYKITSFDDSNSEGPFKNTRIEPLRDAEGKIAPAPQALYDAAAAAYEAMRPSILNAKAA